MPLPKYELPWYLNAANAVLKAAGRLVFGPMWVIEAMTDDRWEVIPGTYGTRGEAEREAARLGSVADGLQIRTRRQTEADKMQLARAPLPPTRVEPRRPVAAGEVHEADCPTGTRVKGAARK